MRTELKDLLGEEKKLTAEQDWADVWTRGFMPLFTDVELKEFWIWLSSESQPTIGRCHFRSVFEMVCNDAVKRLGKHVYHWPFFAWFDAGGESSKLVGLLNEELSKREARRAQEPSGDPLPAVPSA